MMALASTQMKAGQLDSALANYNKAATLCTKFNYELGLAQLYADLGLLLQGLGQFAEAEQMLLKSFTVAEKLEEIGIASVAAGNLGLLYRETQDLDRAEEMVRQALQLEERLKHKDGVARANLNLGTILFEKARFDEAATHFKESLRLYLELGLPDHASNAVFNLGNAHRALKQAADAEVLLSAGDRSLHGRERCLRRGQGRGQSRRRLSRQRPSRRGRGGVQRRLGCGARCGRGARHRHADAEPRRALAYARAARGRLPRLRESLELCMEIDARTEALELKVLMGQIGCL